MWSLVYFVIVVLPQFGVLALIWPDLMQATEEAARSGGPEGAGHADIEAALGVQGHVALMQIVQFPTTLLWAVLFYGAVYRAMLEPENSSRWYMRLGMQEFWLGAVGAVACTMFFFVAAIAVIPVLMLSFFLAAMNGGVMSIGVWIVVGLSVLLCMALLWWAAIRLSLAYPMSFTRRTFLLFESWAMTRGHALRIFLTHLAALGWGLLTLVAFAVLSAALMFGGVAGLGAFAGINEAMGGDPNAFLTGIPTHLIVAMVLAALATCAIASIQTAVISVIIAAPSAAIYRQLRDQPQPAA